MATAKKSSKSSTSKSSEKKKAPEKKVEEVNPVGRPREIFKVTSNDGMSASDEAALKQIADYMQVTESRAALAMVKRAIFDTRIRGVSGVAAQLMPHR